MSTEAPARQARSGGGPAAVAGASSDGLRIRGLTKRYADVVALDGVDLAVLPGCVHGLVGPNGAGKSTVMAAMSGLIAADAGTMELAGQPLAGVRRRVPGGLAGTVEEPRFYPYLSARANLELMAHLDDTGGMSPGEALERVGLAAKADVLVSGFSMGMRTRLAVASCLLRSPALLVLDEPTSGLDPSAAADLLVLIRALAGSGTSVLLSSHDLGAVHEVCDVVTILVGGRVVTSGPMDALAELAPQPSFILATSADAIAVRIAKRSRGIRIETQSDRLIVQGGSDAMDLFVLALAEESIAVRRLEPHESPLRLLFDELTLPVGAVP